MVAFGGSIIVACHVVGPITFYDECAVCGVGKSRSGSPHCEPCRNEHERAYHARWRQKIVKITVCRDCGETREAKCQFCAACSAEREHARARNANLIRRSRIKGLWTFTDWDAICAQQNNRCFDCGDSESLTAGHLVPISKGGVTVPENIVAQCMPCNRKQGKKTHPEAGRRRLDAHGTIGRNIDLPLFVEKKRAPKSKIAIEKTRLALMGKSKSRLHRQRLSNARRKLTDEQEQFIRYSAHNFSQHELGEMFGVTQSLISLVIKGKNRRWASMDLGTAESSQGATTAQSVNTLQPAS